MTSAADNAADDDKGGDSINRDPDVIAHEIEQTRAELADTIDAIADRISPKNVASRGAQAVKTQVSTARSKISGDSTDSAASGGAAGESDPAGSDASGSSLPVGPIVAIAGVILVIVVFVRKRRSR